MSITFSLILGYFEQYAPQRHRAHRERFFICREIPANENHCSAGGGYNLVITMRMKAIGRLINTNNVIHENLTPEGLSLFARSASPDRAKTKDSSPRPRCLSGEYI
jgi:hypothetical protein